MPESKVPMVAGELQGDIVFFYQKQYRQSISQNKTLEYKPRTKNNIVKDKYGNLLFANIKVAGQWKEYIKDLYRREEIIYEQHYLEHKKEVEPYFKGPVTFGGFLSPKPRQRTYEMKGRQSRAEVLGPEPLGF